MPPPRSHHLLRSTIWAMLVFLVGFVGLILLVSHYFLLPAMQVSQGASDPEKHQLSASAALLMTVVLFILIVGILMVFRVRRFFFPASGSASRDKTQYVDAWAESARRMKSQPETDDQDDDEDDEELSG